MDVTDTQNPRVLHAVGRSADARGNLYRQLLGNGVMTERTVDPESGRVEQIRSGRLLDGSIANLSGSIQDLHYQFDSLGNLLKRAAGRTDLNGLALESVEEDFTYDDLNRLKTRQTDWADASIPGRDHSYFYNALGNLTQRGDPEDDPLELDYDQVNGAGVHAVTSADGQSYHYDAYGNLVQRGTETLEYNVFNKPTRIDTTTFEYGPDHQRFKQVDGNRTVYYVNGGQYKEIVQNGETTTRSTVGGFYVRSVSNSGTEETYLHQDHLGSVEAMSDELGMFITRMSFEPWGQRQQADWDDGDPTGGQSGTYPTDRGFTGHEMLDSTDLVHMNGRVYDPVIGRFLSPDLLIQAPHNSQSYNRYSYVLNNPLSRVDPSGYASEDNGDGGCSDGRGGCPTLEEDLKTLQEFVDGNENFDSVGELVQEYNDNGMDSVERRALFGDDGVSSQNLGKIGTNYEILTKAAEASGALVVFTYDDYGLEVADHSAVWVGEDGVGWLLDPSGSFVPSGINAAEGAQRDIWDNVRLTDFITHQMSLGSEDVRMAVVQLSLSQTEERNMIRNLETRMLSGTSVWGGPVCSGVCSQFLRETMNSPPSGSGVPGFLHDQLIDQGHEQW